MACNHSHHSSEQMNFTVGFRPLDIVFVYSATQIWGIFVHTELVDKMGWLEYILVTPSHHRIHHASNPRYLDKNMGMFLIVRDQLFGTFQPDCRMISTNRKNTVLQNPWKKQPPLLSFSMNGPISERIFPKRISDGGRNGIICSAPQDGAMMAAGSPASNCARRSRRNYRNQSHRRRETAPGIREFLNFNIILITLLPARRLSFLNLCKQKFMITHK
jgi:hypothetical protein